MIRSQEWTAGLRLRCGGVGCLAGEEIADALTVTEPLYCHAEQCLELLAADALFRGHFFHMPVFDER